MRTSSLALIAGLALTSASCTLYGFTARATENIAVDYVPGAPIRVSTRNGSIQVYGGATGPQVQVQATITTCGHTQAEADERLEQVKISCARDAEDRLVIGATYPDQPRGRDGVSFVVRLPDADGALLRTSNGSIKVREIAGHLDADTSNGGIDVEDHSGRLTIRSSNGALKLHDVAGPVTARTSNGPVDVALRREAEGPVDLRTSNGRVTLAVGAGFCGAMQLDTSNGRVQLRNDAGAPVRSSLQRRHGTLRFAGEGADSKLRTSNGSITVTVR